MSASGELFFKPPKLKSEYSRQQTSNAEKRSFKALMKRKTLQQLIFLPAIQPQAFLVPKVSNFPLFISIQGSSWPIHFSVILCSLLLSAPAQCISIEGSSSQNRTHQPLLTLRVWFGNKLHGPSQLYNCGAFSLATHWLPDIQEAAEVPPSVKTHPEQFLQALGLARGVELVQRLHSINFLIQSWDGLRRSPASSPVNEERTKKWSEEEGEK